MACQYILRLKPGALFWGGLPCSLHVWISRGTSGKTRDNPRGIFDGSFKHECVKVANLLAARYALLVLVCLVRQVHWITEQPVSSVAMYLPYLEVALHTARQMLGFPAGLLQKLYLDFKRALYDSCAHYCIMCLPTPQAERMQTGSPLLHPLNLVET